MSQSDYVMDLATNTYFFLSDYMQKRIVCLFIRKEFKL